MRLHALGTLLVAGMMGAGLSSCAPEGPARAAAADRPVVKGGMDETGPYEVVSGWLKPAKNHGDDWTWGSIADIKADTPDRIFIAARGDRPKHPNAKNERERRKRNYIVVVDRNGNEIENWSQWDTMMVAPHSIAISPYDPERHVWVVDNSRQQVWKFTNDGKRLVQTWGEANVVGADQNHFNGVSSIAFLPDGSFLLGDGYDGIRVVKYDAKGQYVKEWGAGGPKPFNRIHAVAVDSQRRVIVSDRNNSRVQVFTENGDFIEEWPNMRRPNSIHVDAEHDVWVLDGRAGMGRLLKYDEAGVLQDYWGVGGGVCGEPPSPPPGPQCVEGAMSNPHGMSVDSEGNLYIADYDNDRALKFVPRSGADPARLVGQPLVLRP